MSNSLSEGDTTWRGEHPDTARLVTGDVVAAVQALKDEPGDEQIWVDSYLDGTRDVSGVAQRVSADLGRTVSGG